MIGVETRSHLGPAEIEIDSPVYAILLVGGSTILTPKLYGDKAKALEAARTQWAGSGYVVRLNSTNS